MTTYATHTIGTRVESVCMGDQGTIIEDLGLRVDMPFYRVAWDERKAGSVGSVGVRAI